MLSTQQDSLLWYIGIYLTISAATCIMGGIRAILVFSAALRSSKGLFEDLLRSVMSAPMRWFDTVPQGRILNRFVADMSLLDGELGFDILFGLERSFEMIGIAATAGVLCPPLIPPAVIFLALCTYMGSVYLGGAREIKRMESVARSPIFEQLDSCIKGLSTIRAFGLVDRYVQLMHAKINNHARASWHLWTLNSWITLRLTLLVALFSTVTASVVVYTGTATIPASAAGLILSLVFRYNITIVQAVKQYANLEMDMSAVERVVEYTGIPSEPQTGRPVPAAWPTAGRLEITDLVAGYAPNLPPSLNGISLAINPRQRVGIVGRTGAGKSSLTLALFRFLEARSGHIRIDGIDISAISLHDLRTRIAIIPQDPVLFSGTLRSNLDPSNQHDDTELYSALEKACFPIARPHHPFSPESSEPASHLSPSPDQPEKALTLSTPLTPLASNLSLGQRQLLCLARASLANPKILILDEATSAIDTETDAAIQRSIRDHFKNTTLLVVAHRLSTVRDFDVVVVMEGGRVVEMGAPGELEGRGGVWAGMVGAGEGDGSG